MYTPKYPLKTHDFCCGLAPDLAEVVVVVVVVVAGLLLSLVVVVAVGVVATISEKINSNDILWFSM